MSSGIELRDVYKGYTLDQDKLIAPEETLKRVKERLAGLDLKILKKTIRIDQGRLGIPVFLSLCGPDAVRLTGTQKQMGKGLSPEQAETSALMELVERFSFFGFMDSGPGLRADYNQAEREAEGRIIGLDKLFLSLHDETSDPEVAGPLLRRLPLRWVWARNLAQDRDELIPLDWFFMINEYNGPAAGNCLEEALNQALGEVVERHVASVIDHTRQLTPTIDPASVPQGPAREALAAFAREGIELHLKDFSLDTGIPTVAALAWDPATLGQSEMCFLAGTTTDPEKSVIRALTEVQQMGCDFIRSAEYKPTLPKFASPEEAGFLIRAEETVPLSALPKLAHDNLKVEIERQTAALGAIGLVPYAINVTHPQVGIPVVYVILPGAHFRERTRGSSVFFHAAKLAAGHPDEPASLAALEALAQAGPDDYSLSFFGGLALERAGRPEEALALFRRSLEMGPSALDRPAVLTHLGVCLKDMGRFQEALEFLGQARDLDPGQWEIAHLIGFCRYSLGDYAGAMESFSRALEIDPGSGIDYANIGSCLRQLGRTKEAVEMYKSALEIDPSLDFARDNIRRLSGSEGS